MQNFKQNDLPRDCICIDSPALLIVIGLIVFGVSSLIESRASYVGKYYS